MVRREHSLTFWFYGKLALGWGARSEFPEFSGVQHGPGVLGSCRVGEFATLEFGLGGCCGPTGTGSSGFRV